MSARRLLLAMLALSACGTTESPCGPSTGTVVEVVDGDTLVLESGVKIRLLLVDAPEITLGHNDCYGHEAATFTSDLVNGQQVSLRYDEAGCTDRYGRSLAYVSVGGVELNSELAKKGLACALYIAPAGTSRHEEFEDYQSVAQTNRTGMWGACTEIPCSK